MKKIILSGAALVLVVAFSFAQEPQKKTPEPSKMEQKKQASIAECCIMKDGKMMHYKNGKETQITKEMDMNGIKVMPDGTCKMKKGKTMKLMEGECCDRYGNVHKECSKMLKKS